MRSMLIPLWFEEPGFHSHTLVHINASIGVSPLSFPLSGTKEPINLKVQYPAPQHKHCTSLPTTAKKKNRVQGAKVQLLLLAPNMSDSF
jgi:hypothetical protein